MGACRIKQERQCDGCVSSSAGNLQLRRRHDHGSHWLPAKPIRAECCSNKLFIIIPDGEEAEDSRSGPINGQAEAHRPPHASPCVQGGATRCYRPSGPLQGHVTPKPLLPIPSP